MISFHQGHIGFIVVDLFGLKKIFTLPVQFQSMFLAIFIFELSVS